MGELLTFVNFWSERRACFCEVASGTCCALQSGIIYCNSHICQTNHAEKNESTSSFDENAIAVGISLKYVVLLP